MWSPIPVGQEKIETRRGVGSGLGHSLSTGHLHTTFYLIYTSTGTRRGDKVPGRSSVTLKTSTTRRPDPIP